MHRLLKPWLFSLPLSLCGCGTDTPPGGADGGKDPSSGGSNTGADSSAGGSAAGGASATGGRSSTGGESAAGGRSSTGGGSATSGGSSTGGVTGSGGAAGTGGAGTGGVFDPSGTPPALEPGVWREITPSDVDLNGSYGVTVVEMDPTNVATLYLCIDQRGLYKSTDAGSTWKRLGVPGSAVTDGVARELDSPVSLRVDPRDPKHLYATQGVRGATLGFWVSHDAGVTWKQPPGFVAILPMATNDVTTLAVDPKDFDHILIGSHSPWNGGVTAGILESTNGGDTFTMHAAAPGWGSGTIGINFLFSPKLGIGNSQTWLVGTEHAGFWRTTDSGAGWSQLSEHGAIHGGNHELYFTKDGIIYSGANNQMVRSTDRGTTWEPVGPSFRDGYYQVIGDGNVLYAQVANTGQNSVGPQSYVTSPETDGKTWTPYRGGAQKFSDGPATMVFEPMNRILYSANWAAGFWALKVLD